MNKTKVERKHPLRASLPMAALLLGTTVLAGLPQAAFAQTASQSAPTAPVTGEAIQAINVIGAQRLEADTILTYIKLRLGQPYTQAAADQALKDLFATELFSDVQIRNDGGKVTIEVKENPVIKKKKIGGSYRVDLL